MTIVDNGYRYLSMPLDNIWMILLQQTMHLLNLVSTKRIRQQQIHDPITRLDLVSHFKFIIYMLAISQTLSTFFYCNSNVQLFIVVYFRYRKQKWVCEKSNDLLVFTIFIQWFSMYGRLGCQVKSISSATPLVCYI